MSLSDLKNKGRKKPKRQLSVDEFIEDAKAYAQGKSVLDKGPVNKPTKRRFKNATFTLSPDNIEHLSELAEATGMAKSKLIRLMIEQATGAKFSLPEPEPASSPDKQQKEEGSS